mmetsp:Transcript_36909/g.37214  ORF Transcript_36909/g.37214 Transcript_36909/m.37214 type:complete len:303 (-) Transcript_36909:365-1273(-)
MGLFSRLREKLESLDDEKVVIKADVRMISGCMDAQTSADVSNVDDFQLPDPAGKPGGACTSALLKVLYDEEKTPTDDLTFSEVLEQMRTVLDEEYEQIPQLSSSHALDVSTPFTVVGGEGTKRALLIGINYIGQNGELSGCHNDALRIKKYLMDVYGYEEENFTYLMDNGVYDDPTYDNILAAFDDIVAKSEAGDSVFVHYSGHGGFLADDSCDEEDGKDETLIPVNYTEAGQIRDDTVFNRLVLPMADDVTLTCLMDCCHSGTILDLPYKFKAGMGESVMSLQPGFRFDKFFRKIGLSDEE